MIKASLCLLTPYLSLGRLLPLQGRGENKGCLIAIVQAFNASYLEYIQKQIMGGDWGRLILVKGVQLTSPTERPCQPQDCPSWWF